MSRKSLLAAIGVMVVSNIIALIGVSRNRSGDPIATMELTERELPLQNTDRDNTGIDLRFNWVRQSPLHPEGALNRAKLEQLGFRFRFPADSPEGDATVQSREAYVVLEYQGALWKEWLMNMEEEKRRLASASLPSAGVVSRNVPAAPLLESRLFVVDVSGGAGELRARYPDQGKYLMVRGVIRARPGDVRDPLTGAVLSRDYFGFVAEVLPGSIHVPLPLASPLALLKPRKPTEEPRYGVTLRYGRNLEPWVDAVKLR